MSCHTNIKELSLLYYLPIAVERKVEVIPFSRVLVLYEMQTDSSRFWTQVAESISYNENVWTFVRMDRHTYTHTHIYIYIIFDGGIDILC